MSGTAALRTRPLDGVRVLDLSRMIAGGVSGMMLADFGADVVKVEQPGSGDPLRQWTSDGAAFWWQVYARNKRYITLNLKSADGQDLLRRLMPRFDVVMESFVPGTLERMGIGWDVLQSWNPKLILVRISGWGQTGPVEPASRLRHAGRGRERICGDERRTRRRADRARRSRWPT